MLHPPVFADYANQQESCAERGKNLRLGQTVADGCSQYDPHRGGGGESDSHRSFGGIWLVELGAAMLSPRSFSPWQVGVVGGVGAAFAETWWEFGVTGRAAVYPSPREARTYSTTLSLHFAVRIPVNDDTVVRIGVGPAFGPWWTGGRNGVAHVDFDTFVQLAARSTKGKAMHVGPLIRATHTWALPYREDPWVVTAEVGITF